MIEIWPSKEGIYYCLGAFLLQVTEYLQPQEA